MTWSGPTPEFHRLDIREDCDDRLDTYLSNRLRLSRSRTAALISQGLVRVNDGPALKSYRPLKGDRIDVSLPPPPPQPLEPEDIPLSVVYEDDALIVVDKPAGMVVHPAPGNPSGTLVNALLHHAGSLSSLGLPQRPGIVHRLDKDTSGLLVAARSDEVHRHLSADLARRRITRGYLAAAWGHLQDDETEIDLPIARDPADRKRMAVVEGGRRAVSHVRRLERWRAADLLALKLETGRTHQIRVHLKAHGHPVVGDPFYAAGWERGLVGAGGRWAEELARRCGRLFLHAARLAFRHPDTGELLRFSSPLPEDLQAAVEWARETS
jgi:23S rRNA pseudouridine1911/1915/1917 synthase